MPPVEPHTDTNPLVDKAKVADLFADPSTDPVWLGEQMDRLLGYEILMRSLHAQYQEMKPEVLADKIGAHKGIAYSITESIKAKLHAEE